jgi:hypothetical protein
MLHEGDICCGDCEHYSEDGCEQAAEALVLEGWPRSVVCPEDSADASRCPEFSPARGYELALDEERSAQAAQSRVAALRNYLNG